MKNAKYVPTKNLFQALIRAKRSFGRFESEAPTPPAAPASHEEVPPFTLREDAFDSE